MNIKKANRDRFRNETCQFIEENGGKKNADTLLSDCTQYILPTKTGDLHLTVRHEPSELHFIAGNFVGSEEKAKERFGMWKCNYIISEQSLDTFECIAGFKRHLETLIN